MWNKLPQLNSTNSAKRALCFLNVKLEKTSLLSTKWQLVYISGHLNEHRWNFDLDRTPEKPVKMGGFSLEAILTFRESGTSYFILSDSQVYGVAVLSRPQAYTD